MRDSTLDIAVAHVDDAGSVAQLLDTLAALHGPSYEFAVGRWDGRTAFEPHSGRVLYRFVISAKQATIDLHPGDLVRGIPSAGPYTPLDSLTARVCAPHQEALWPGDVVAVADGDEADAVFYGEGVYFEIGTEQTAYQTPRLAMLRHLPDKPGGCAAYDGAFRREALPPARPTPAALDHRGVNRVNQHTLDMRIDRDPPPIRHYHGPIGVADHQVIAHSETAIVLPRAVYGLPEVDQPDRGHLILYRRPAADPTDKLKIPLRPGSIVVTPATQDAVCGHAFENAFAMLVAIPGFVAPYHFIEEVSR